jgi:hypothetical protein
MRSGLQPGEHSSPDLFVSSFESTAVDDFLCRISIFLQKKLDLSDVNQRWPQKMAPLFEPIPGLEEGESLAMMEEVFYMAGIVSSE